MPNGYNGKILHVDLTHGTADGGRTARGFYRKYMGGSAMGMYYILRDMPAGADALAPENVLTLMTERDHRRADLGPEPPERQRQVPGQRGDRRFTVRRLFPGGAEVCRFRWHCGEGQSRQSRFTCRS